MKRGIILFILSFFLLFSACSTPEQEQVSVTTQPIHHISLETTQTVATEATEYGIDSFRSCQENESYQWLMALKAEDVAFVEFVNLNDQEHPFRRYEGEDIQEVIDIFQSNLCYEYVDSASWRGYFTTEFHVIMKDGTAHTVCSIETTKTVIDGAAFSTISSWLIYNWPETGVEALPEDWEQQVADRDYHIAKDTSFLGTHAYRVQREGLDREYDTSTFMGSKSRNYPIGRGTVTISATDSTTTGVTLDAYWTGTFRGGKLVLKPEFWLEKWVEAPEAGYGSYVPMELGNFTDYYTPDNTAANSIRWRVLWGSTVGSLESGYYRIGMTFYEQINGIQQNETICYAKFFVE